MRSIVMLTAAELIKNRKQMLSQMVIILFASMLLSLGLLTALNFNSYINARAKELNVSHAIFAFSEERYDERYTRYFQNNEEVTAVQKDEVLVLSTNLKMPVSNLDTTVFGVNYDNMGAMNQVGFVGDTLPPDDNSVYVPYVFKFNGGLQLGSAIGIGLNENPNDASKEVVYEFTVAGFTEDIMLGSSNSGAMGIYFPDGAYKIFSGQLSEHFKGQMISVNLTDPNRATAFIDEFIRDELNGENITAYSSSLEFTILVRTSMSVMFAGIIVLFAVMIQMVSQIVIRFRIGDSIEMGMRNYGALKALGYTSAQITSAIVLQFAVTTIFICICGIALSYPAAAFMSGLLSTQTGLNWVPMFDADISFISFGLIISITILTAFLTSRRIKKAPPIEALRGGVTLNTLRHNVLPFEKTNLPVTAALAAKTTFINFKQNLLIVLILISVSVAVIFSVVMSYNTPRDSFVNTMLGQSADLVLTVNDNADAFEVRDEVLKMDGVEKAAMWAFALTGMDTVMYDDQIISLTIMPDFAEVLNPHEVYQGRFPSHPNEVAIGGYLAQQKGKRIGDTVRLTLQDREEEYIITGFRQNTSTMGLDAFITSEGFRLLQPYYKESSVGVVLSQNTDIYAFIDELEQRFGDDLADIYNMKEIFDIQMTSILGMIYSLCLSIEVITVLVVIFLLFLVVRTLVLRRRQELGIQKALGFTTFQLMNQIAGSFVPIAAVGTGIGCIAGALCMDTFAGFIFAGSGVMKMTMEIPVEQVAIAGVLLCLLTYAVSLLVSIRIRKISAYQLFTD